jgi:hypothetical protein
MRLLYAAALAKARSAGGTAGNRLYGGVGTLTPIRSGSGQVAIRRPQYSRLGQRFLRLPWRIALRQSMYRRLDLCNTSHMAMQLLQ